MQLEVADAGGADDCAGGDCCAGGEIVRRADAFARDNTSGTHRDAGGASRSSRIEQTRRSERGELSVEAAAQGMPSDGAQRQSSVQPEEDRMHLRARMLSVAGLRLQ